MKNLSCFTDTLLSWSSPNNSGRPDVDKPTAGGAASRFQRELVRQRHDFTIERRVHSRVQVHLRVDTGHPVPTLRVGTSVQ